MRLTARDIKARYRQSAMGLMWAFITPVSKALIFIFLNGAGLVTFRDTSVPYPVYALFGTVLWQLFASSVTGPLTSLNRNRSLLVKLAFPREALVLSTIGEVLFDFGVSTVILVVVFVAYGMQPTAGLLLAPLACLLLMLLGITIGLFLAPIGMLYTDINAMLGSLLTFWFFLTPVVYAPPDTWPFSLLSILNPVSPLLLTARNLALGQPIENPAAFLVVSGLTLVGAILAFIFYRVSILIVIERVNT